LKEFKIIILGMSAAGHELVADSRSGSFADDTESVTSVTSENLHRDNNDNLCSYLSKRTRDGRWQKRWFETNGFYLTYYKSRRKEKLLASLWMPQVGEIKVMKDLKDEIGTEGFFSLELDSRLYTLKAKTDADAQEWVNTLVNLKKASMGQQSSKANTNNNTVPPSPILGNKNPLQGGASNYEVSADGVQLGWDKQNRPMGMFPCC
jgi:hypothetical protein